MKGEAEAKAVQAKGEAEAVAMDKKAEAMKKYGQAAMAQMMIEVLPKMAEQIAKPVGSIDNLTVFGGGTSGSGVTSISENVPLVMAQTFQAMKAATGVDLAEIMRGQSGTETTQNVNVTGEKNVDVAVSNKK